MVQRGQGQSAGKSQVFEDSMARSPDPGFGVNQSQNSSFKGSMARSPAPGFGWHPSHNSSFEGSMARSPAPGFGWNSHQNSGYWRVSFKARSQVRSWVLSLPADFNTLRRFFSCRRTEMKWKGWRGKWCDAGSKQLQPDKCWYVQNEGANLVRCSLDTPSTNMAHTDEVVPCPACALTSRLACCSWRFKACLSAFKAARRSSIPGAWAAAAAAAPSAASATAAAADDDMLYCVRLVFSACFGPSAVCSHPMAQWQKPCLLENFQMWPFSQDAKLEEIATRHGPWGPKNGGYQMVTKQLLHHVPA